MTAIRLKLVEGGRILVPATNRRAMKLEKGDTVLLELHGDELRIRPAAAALRRLQGSLPEKIPTGVSLVEELIAERRAEAAGEQQNVRTGRVRPALSAQPGAWPRLSAR
jgi:bifunctional DNA-binding transcriptional regulator/antitoxin component of YhaV-PrlF toxin-antitoxin module